MREQQTFPFYLPDHPDLNSRRVSLMLTYEQIVATASALALLQKILSMGKIRRSFYDPMLSDHEKSLQTAVHNSCINCALSLEEHAKGEKHGER